METTTQNERTYVDPCPGRKGTDLIREDCGCGDGIYHAPSGIHWNNGKGDTKWCFDCNGHGYRMVKVSSIRARERRQVKADNARAAQAAAWEANRVEREAAELAACLDEAYAEQARRESRIAVPEGVQTVTGTLVSIKSQEGYYGRTTLKMLVEDERGFKVWGTYPTAFYHDKEDADRGDRVTFTATLTRSDRDRDFGFFKAPKQAKVTERAPRD